MNMTKALPIIVIKVSLDVNLPDLNNVNGRARDEVAKNPQKKNPALLIGLFSSVLFKKS